MRLGRRGLIQPDCQDVVIYASRSILQRKRERKTPMNWFFGHAGWA
tara:strand:- start:500 stop:637 length:138 start_codon:yes stop_codon:yes gene_type:complete